LRPATCGKKARSKEKAWLIETTSCPTVNIIILDPDDVNEIFAIILEDEDHVVISAAVLAMTEAIVESRSPICCPEIVHMIEEILPRFVGATLLIIAESIDMASVTDPTLLPAVTMRPRLREGI